MQVVTDELIKFKAEELPDTLEWGDLLEVRRYHMTACVPLER